MFGRLESGGAETILGVVFAVPIEILAPRDWLLLGFYVGFLRLRGSAGRGNWRTTAGHCRTTSRPAVSGRIPAGTAAAVSGRVHAPPPLQIGPRRGYRPGGRYPVFTSNWRLVSGIPQDAGAWYHAHE